MYFKTTGGAGNEEGNTAIGNHAGRKRRKPVVTAEHPEKGEEEYRLVGEKTFSEIPTQEGKKTLVFPAGIVSLWEVENPALYEVKTQLVTGNPVNKDAAGGGMKTGQVIIDEVVTTVGFRQAVFQKMAFT